MAKKKRKLNVINLLILLGICLCMGLGFVVFTYKTKTVSINPGEINNIDYSETEKLDLELSSDKYLLIRLNDFKVLYGDKTDEMKYVSGVNCLPETAYEEMIATKNRFNKGKEKIIGYHLIQSFAEGEVTPEVAHELGLEYVNEVFGKDFEVVVATHLNTDNVHNHIVINSVSLKTGKKFYDYHASRDYLRIV